MVFKFFDKKISNGTVKNKVISNKELTEELHKPITNKFEKRKFWNILELPSKSNKGFRFLCVIDIYSKHSFVIS